MHSGRWIIVEIDGQVYALDAASVVHMMDYKSVSPRSLVGAPPSVRGVFEHRGSIICIVDGRTLMGMPSFEESLQELKDTLAAREQDHVAWLEELRRCCEEECAFTKATDPHKCAFGKWYDALMASEDRRIRMTGGDVELEYILRSFDEPHKRIHAIAQEALGLVEAGQKDNAQALIQRTWDTQLGSMRQLFASLLKGVEANRRDILIVVEQDGERFALVVDKVRAMGEFSDEEISPHGLDGLANPCIEGVYPSTAHGEVLVLSVPAMVSVGSVAA